MAPSPRRRSRSRNRPAGPVVGSNSQTYRRNSMSVEVRIPTVLRTYTGGQKAVHGNGATLQEVLEDIDARNPGLKDRIVEAEALRRFVNVYVNDEDVRFSGGLNAATTDGDVVVVLPAVAGGWASHLWGGTPPSSTRSAIPHWAGRRM